MLCAVLDNPVQHGCYRLDNPSRTAVAEVPQVVPARTGGGATLHYLDLLRHRRHVSESELVLVAYSQAEQSYKKPYVKPAPKLFAVKYVSIGEIRLSGSAEWDHWDQGEDDDTLAILLAMRYFHDV